MRAAVSPLSRILLLLATLNCSFGCAYAVNIVTGDRALQELQAAEQSLMQGRIDGAVATLQRILSVNPKDGHADLLLCRSFYAEQQQDAAIGACENAVQALPQDSEAWDWMGRAYGMKASQAGPVAAFALARKVKAAFEAAVALDPSNGAAVDDLGEYYVYAPSIIGGGQDKAVSLANRVATQLPQQAHRIQALAAEKRKDYGTAEREFKAAIDVGKGPDTWVDLGAFYWRRQQQDKAVDALKHSLAVDRAKDFSIVNAASLLDSMHREPQLAEQAMEQYLSSDAKSDAAPVVKVDVTLGKLLDRQGDKAGANIEFNRALELASAYEPAKLALKQP